MVQGTSASALLPFVEAVEVAAFDDLLDRAADYLRASRAPGTLALYESNWRLWEAWCRVRRLSALPAEAMTVAAFLADQAETVAPSTLSGRLSAIRWGHEQAGQVSPTTHPQVRGVLAGIRRTFADEPRQVRPIFLDDLRAMLAALDVDTTKGLRDRALLTLGWWGAFRRSEVAALNAGDVAEAPEGFIVTVRRSKSDQEGKGRRIPLAYVHGAADACPVRAVRAWTAEASVSGGALLRRVDRWGHVRDAGLSGESVAEVVKESAARIGIDPHTVGGHSLRSGFVSECDRRGVPDAAVMRTTGHRTAAMLDVYTRPRAIFEGSAPTYFDEVGPANRQVTGLDEVAS